MKASKNDLPKTMESKELITREAEWGDMHVGYETYDKDSEWEPLHKGLPDDLCQCPHWGYLLKGRMKVKYKDHEEIVNAGEVYYMEPGHVPFMEAGTELMEFSPMAEYTETMEVINRNFDLMQTKK
ncbi:hypothetical protein [Methanolobus zinderi]|nr:hypothetical protein [Methanolobus zinderi]